MHLLLFQQAADILRGTAKNLGKMMIHRALSRAKLSFGSVPPLESALTRARGFQNKAYDAEFDAEELAEARKWHATFGEESLPKGQTTYSSSSGPGGQHVNKSVVAPGKTENG